MHVVEGIIAVLGLRRPVRGKAGPTVADIDAAKMQPPQDRRGVEHVQRQRRMLAVDRRVEQRQRLVGLAELVVEEREVPPIVHLQKAVAGPVVRVVPHPGDAVALAALHLHDMGHRMLRPAVARLELDRPPAECFGAGIVAHLLEAEGLHGERRVIAGHAVRPCRHGACDAIAQHARIAGEEVDLVAGEQASASRGSSMVTSSSTRPASCQRPSARWPRAATWPRSRGVAGRSRAASWQASATAVASWSVESPYR